MPVAEEGSLLVPALPTDCAWAWTGYSAPDFQFFHLVSPPSISSGLLPGCVVLQENFNSPFLCGALIHLSSLPCTFWSCCRTALVPLNFLSRTEISCPWCSHFFPVPMPQFQLVQVFHVQFYGVGMKSEAAAHGYTAAGPYFSCLLCSS